MHKIDMIRVAAFAFGIEVIADQNCGRPDPPRWRHRAVNPALSWLPAARPQPSPWGRLRNQS
jgi:hypothetical protein